MSWLISDREAKLIGEVGRARWRSEDWKTRRELGLHLSIDFRRICWMVEIGAKVCLFERITALSASNRDVAAGDMGSAGHQRRESESQETKAWAIGRSASAKLREGFGFRRSMSTQGV